MSSHGVTLLLCTSRIILVIALAAGAWRTAAPAFARGNPSFTSSQKLLLKKSALPSHYRYRGYHVVSSVETWDGGVRSVIALDAGNGWLEGAEEMMSDPRGHDAMLSVQLFRAASGARADFALFFTNQHPETRFVPGQDWLGGSSIRGFGDVATIYRISDESSHCPTHLVSGLSFVYGNAILSVAVCTRSVGDQGARDLAGRLLRRARAVAGT